MFILTRSVSLTFFKDSLILVNGFLHFFEEIGNVFKVIQIIWNQ